MREEGVVLVTVMALTPLETRPMKPSSRPFSGMGLRQIARATLAAYIGPNSPTRQATSTTSATDMARAPTEGFAKGRPQEALHVVGEGPPRLLENYDATYTREGEGHNRTILQNLVPTKE